HGSIEPRTLFRRCRAGGEVSHHGLEPSFQRTLLYSPLRAREAQLSGAEGATYESDGVGRIGRCGYPTRNPPASKNAWIHVDRSAYAGGGHRGEHDHIQRDESLVS